MEYLPMKAFIHVAQMCGFTPDSVQDYVRMIQAGKSSYSEWNT